MAGRSDLSAVRERAWPLLALLWALVVRLPFAWRPTIDGDAALFWIVGHGWRTGSLPYAGVWDVKPPGTFLLFAGVDALFGNDPVGGRWLTALCVGFAAAGLVRIGARLMGSARAGLFAALLYPPFTLLLDGLGCKPELLAAPFVIWGIALTLEKGTGGAIAAGVLIGFAGTIKQTVAFEAAFLLILLARRGDGRALAGYVAGLAAAPLAFCLYFAAHGLFGALIDASVFGAAARLHGDGGALYEGPVRLLVTLKPALPLLAAAGFCWAERRRIGWRGAAIGPVLLWGWLAAAALGALAMRVAYPPYALPLLAPLCLTAGLLLARIDEARRAVALLVLAMLVASPFAARRLFPDDGAEDATPARIAAAVRHIAPGAPIWVVDYEPAIYQLAAAPVPTRFPLPQHLLCDFPALPTPPAQEIARIVASRPAVLIVSASRRRMVCEKPARVDAAMRAAIAAGYRRAGVFPAPYGPIELWRR